MLHYETTKYFRTILAFFKTYQSVLTRGAACHPLPHVWLCRHLRRSQLRSGQAAGGHHVARLWNAELGSLGVCSRGGSFPRPEDSGDRGGVNGV
jgi:hypothetical protein